MNYNESSVAGSEYTRCKQITIYNPLGGQPMVEFAEERATLLAGRTITENAAGLRVPVDPAEIIELINPETGEQLGSSVTHMQIYVMLFSLYIAKAQARDAKAAEPPAP